MHETLLYHIFFFFNDTATTEIYTLSLHDALPILLTEGEVNNKTIVLILDEAQKLTLPLLETLRQILNFESEDRKSTRLNSSHANISYAVFCLKKNIK